MRWLDHVFEYFKIPVRSRTMLPGQAVLTEQNICSAQVWPQGCFVAVVGPSGAGKDSLIRGMKTRFSDDHCFVFARRIITRPSDASEDNEAVSIETFAEMASQDAFFLSWKANGLAYGLHAQLRKELARGKVVVANLSREVLPQLKAEVPNACVVHITASKEILAERLRARGREDAAARDARQMRSLALDSAVRADIVIDNSGDFAQSLRIFEQVLRSRIYSAPIGY